MDDITHMISKLIPFVFALISLTGIILSLIFLDKNFFCKENPACLIEQTGTTCTIYLPDTNCTISYNATFCTKIIKCYIHQGCPILVNQFNKCTSKLPIILLFVCVPLCVFWWALCSWLLYLEYKSRRIMTNIQHNEDEIEGLLNGDDDL
jgi:hypothetical protein